jgi:hypothetical protein
MSAEEGVQITVSAEDEFSSTFDQLIEQSQQASETLGGLSESEQQLATTSQDASTSLQEEASAQDEANVAADESGSSFSHSAGAIAGTAGAVGSLGSAMYGLHDAYVRQQDADLRLTDAQNNLAKAHNAVTNATLTLQQAQTKLNDLVAKGITSGPQYQSAQDAVTKAQDSLNNSTLQLQNAQNNLAAAHNKADLAAEAVQQTWLMMATSTAPMLITQLPQMASLIGGVKDALTGAKGEQLAMNAAILQEGGATDEEITSMLGLSAATDELGASEVVATGETEGLDAAMDANPIGLVALAIGGLVAVIGVATDGFRNFTPLVNGLEGAFKDLETAGKDVFGFFEEIFGTDIKIWEAALNDIWTILKPVVQGIETLAGGAGSFFGGIGNAISHFATGGVVTSPTLAMVGESGPEAIIPLSSAGGASSGGTPQIAISSSPDTAILQQILVQIQDSNTILQQVSSKAIGQAVNTAQNLIEGF